VQVKVLLDKCVALDNKEPGAAVARLSFEINNIKGVRGFEVRKKQTYFTFTGMCARVCCAANCEVYTSCGVYYFCLRISYLL